MISIIEKNQPAPKVPEREGCWFTEPAIKLLDDYLKENNCFVFEFGMGSSTIYLKDKCKYLMSVEHDAEWYKKIAKDFSSAGAHTLFHMERPYNTIIDNCKIPIDVIIVDGRDRVKCIQSAIPKLRSAGWLILDNSEREYYQPGIDLMKDWNRIDCRQNRPDKYDFTYPDWTTTIFIKP